MDAANERLQRLVGANSLVALEIAFRQFCAHFGEVQSASVALVGKYGDFSAFCTADMADPRANATLVRNFGFKEIGRRVYLPLVLPADFERRAQLRAAA